MLSEGWTKAYHKVANGSFEDVAKFEIFGNSTDRAKLHAQRD
jgi:hypothetical protein